MVREKIWKNALRVLAGLVLIFCVLAVGIRLSIFRAVDRKTDAGQPRKHALSQAPTDRSVKEKREDVDEYRSKLERIAQKYLNKEVERGAVAKKRIALTFDAGADSEPTPAILDVLKKRGIKATFFLTGAWAQKNPGLTKRIAAEGHEIGNHTYTHPKLTALDQSEIIEELESTENLIKRLTAKTTRPFFRAPFGARDDRVINVISQAGYFSVYWTVDSLDWKEGITEGEVKDRIVSALSPGAIVLAHCGSSVEVRVLPQVIDEIRARGYAIVRLSDVLAD